LNPVQVLIGTVLSARTRDSNTDKAAKQLFAKFPDAKSLAAAPVPEIEKLVKPSGFYRVKARRVKEISQVLLDRFKGKVPEDISDLIKLPGVGYKTGACVIVYGFKQPEIPVDVHVAKVSQRIGLTKEKDPNKIRLDLMEKIPKKYWILINRLFVKFGQTICLSRKPKCHVCLLKEQCTYYHNIFKA